MGGKGGVNSLTLMGRENKTTNMYKHFHNTLSKGKKQELRFANWLLKNNKSVKDFYFRDDGWYDLEVTLNNEFTTFEIKSDFFSRDEREFRNMLVPGDSYRTLFIEFSSWGKKSGIATTLADYWVIVMTLMDEIWIIPTKELRLLIDQNTFEEKTGGDENKSIGYLIPRDKFKYKFKISKDEQPDHTIRNEFNFRNGLEQGKRKQNEFNGENEDSRDLLKILEDYYDIPLGS
jgi:hypothetical protein